MAKADIYASIAARASNQPVLLTEEVATVVSRKANPPRNKSSGCICGLFPWQCVLLGCGHFDHREAD